MSSEIVVVKLGGTTLADQKQVLAEVAAVARKRPVVLVHGGGKRMTEWLERLGVPTRFEGGLRVTDPAALEVAAAVLRGVVNSELVAALRDEGCDAVGLSGVDGGLLIGQRIPDVGLVAHVTGVRRDLLDCLLVAGQVPVVAPLARDEEGVVCNVNADDAAAGIAAGLGATPARAHDRRRRRPRQGRARKLDTITVAEAQALIADGTISGGMVPKVKAALSALAGTTPRRSSRTARPPDALRPRPRGPDVRDPRLRPGPRRRGVTVAAAMLPKRDRHAAIRRLVAARPIASQGELVGAPVRTLGIEVTQATVSRDIAELGLAKVMRGDHSVYVLPGGARPMPARRPTSACGGSSPTSRSRSGGAA